MQASNNMAKKILNTDWAGKRLLRPVGVPLGLVPELRWYMPGGGAMLIDTSPASKEKTHTKAKAVPTILAMGNPL